MRAAILPCFLGRGFQSVMSIPRFGALGASQGVTGMQPLPSDSVGAFYLTLTNVVTGSRVHVETQVAGSQIYDALGSGSVVIPLMVYAGGSGNDSNNLRIKVRKASSGTTYQPWETLATAVVGSNSIYVSQIPDE